MATVIIHPRSGCVLLQKTVNHKTMRLSTGKKSTSRLLAFYKLNSDEEFWKLYFKKYGNEDKTPFCEYAKMLIDATSQNRNRFTQTREEGRVKRLSEYFKDCYIEDIKPSDIQKWQNSFMKDKSLSSVKDYRSVLFRVFESAYNDELISRNPVKAVKLSKKEYREVETYTKVEREILLNNSQGQLHNLLKFAFYSGLRAGELIGLRWDDVDFKTNKIKVCNRIRQGDEAKPKGEKVRVIDLLPQAKNALQKQQFNTGLLKYVFVSKDKKPYFTADCITDSINLLAKNLNISHGGLQKIRRTHNTMLKENGLPLDWILHQMGHSEERVNKTHYTGKIEIERSKLSSIA